MSEGRYGEYGGQYIPETLMNAVHELEEAYNTYKEDPDFVAELDESIQKLRGEAFPSVLCRENGKGSWGRQDYLKREDLNHTGSHKINNVLGQVLLAKKDGKDKSYCRDRRRTARCGHSHGSCPHGHGM